MAVKSRLMDGTYSDIYPAEWGDRPITCPTCGSPRIRLARSCLMLGRWCATYFLVVK